MNKVLVVDDDQKHCELAASSFGARNGYRGVRRP